MMHDQPSNPELVRTGRQRRASPIKRRNVPGKRTFVKGRYADVFEPAPAEALGP